MEYVNTTISEIIETAQTGKTPSTKEPLYYEGDVMWVTPTDLQGQQYISDTITKISDLALLDNQAFLYKENTVLISCIGDIGKTAIIKKAASSNQQITGVRVKENLILPKFFYYWIIRNKQYLSFKANRVTVPILNNTNLRKIDISYPNDLEFQRKVVSQLDSVQTYINDKIKTINVLENLIQSIYFKMFGNPVNNQKGFPRKKLSQVTPKDKIITYGIVQAGPHIDDGIPYIRTGDIKNGKIVSKNLLRTTPEIAKKHDRSKCIEGDIIVSIRATVGQCAIIPKELDGANLTQGTARISPNKIVINPNYLFVTLQSEGFQFLINKYVKGSTFKEITLEKLRNIEIPVPKDLNLQNRFSQIYESIQDVKNKVEQSLEILQQLFQVILQNAFKPDVEIDEEPIFKDLIKKFTVQDLKGNKQRLQYLINLFEQQNFDEFKDFTETRKILFELMDEEEIIQIFGTDNKVKLQVK
ncbi:restriction endonuclease subunit S [Chryseobacterium cucumeris]|uniref:restriction endonuclease subunit S n=1 Tax=Chryseobacterium cucumeris TaxID=1813611 RepID=UPI002454D3B4|nr:restriction endonuclease subunit S [Chryseobacterium cucumeris]MDH5033776.1 restriction endonuclease subunit S [Chryseobacterium cucumeris]